MGGIRIKVDTGGKRENKYGFAAALVYFAAGVCGLLSLIPALNGVDSSPYMVYPAAILLCVLLWASFCYRRPLFYLLLALILLGEGVTAFLMWDRLWEQGTQIAASLAGEANLSQMTVTLLVMTVMPLLALFLFLLEFILRRHLLVCLLISGILLLSPLFGVRISLGTVFLLALFQTAFFVLRLTARGRRRNVFSGSGDAGLTKKSSLAAAAALALSFALAIPFVSFYMQDLYEWAYQAEGQVYTTLRRLTGQDSVPAGGGTINRGNNYRTGTVQLELEASRIPAETLYLRGFAGGEYIGGSWESVDDEEMFQKVAENLRWETWLSSIRGMYHRMYYTLNTYLHREGWPDDISLTITHTNGQYGTYYTPYYSQYNSGYGPYYGYTYLYYEQEQMDIAWDHVPGNFEMQARWYGQIQTAYQEEAQELYTQVPVQLLPRLSSLCAEHPLEDLDEITAFILSTLQTNTVYTLTPGWSPMNEDVVEYFLFEGGRGYCQHFAAAATLMYRLYGIPARYASGYRVEPSDFVLQEDGTYRAEVTDQAAHAWVEILLEDYGWTPVEVTPSTDGSSMVYYPGFDSVTLEQIRTEQGWDQESAAIVQSLRAPGEETASEEQQLNLPRFEIDFEKYQNWFYVLGACLLYTLCLLPFLLDYRRLRRLKKMKGEGCRKIYTRFLQMLHFCGCMKGWDGTEPDFAKETVKQLSWMTEEEICKMQDIVSQAAFGPSQPQEEQETFVYQVYCKAAQGMIPSLKWHKRLIFCFFKAYG